MDKGWGEGATERRGEGAKEKRSGEGREREKENKRCVVRRRRSAGKNEEDNGDDGKAYERQKH